MRALSPPAQNRAIPAATPEEDAPPERATLCGNQPLVWGVPTKLQNSLSRSNRSRFGSFLDESIALIEFSKLSRRFRRNPFNYAHIQVWLNI